MAKREVRYGIVGVKGFSQRHAMWINRAAKAGAPVRIAAAATIFDDPEAVAAGRELAAAGVKVVKDYADLLDMHGEIDIVTLPVGIHLHAPLAVQAMNAGFPVYMEKPVAGTIDEAALLAETERKTGRRLFVGFQTLYQPSTWVLKRRLLDGAVGALRKIVVTVAWPRALSYYRRNRWAGKVSVDGHRIFDCPMNNSAAHFLNAALFLAGSSPERSAVPVGVETELYRSAPIESADSDFSRFSTREGVEIVFNASQSCAEDKDVLVDIHGDRGVVRIVDHEERVLAPWTIDDGAGAPRGEGADMPRAEVFERVAEAFLNPGMREICTIANGCMHTAANQMAFTAGTIRDIPSEWIDRLPRGGGDEVYAVRGMNEALLAMRRDGRLPHETGAFAWSRPASALDKKAADEFLRKIEAIAG